MLPQEMLNSIHQGDVQVKPSEAGKCQDKKSESLISMVQFAESRHHAKEKMVRNFVSPKHPKLIYYNFKCEAVNANINRS